MATRAPAPDLTRVRDVVCVHSGKGGVGKSTVAVNLAVSCARLGMRVCLLDADVHGPSVAHMMGTTERPRASAAAAGRVAPLERHGVRFLSLSNVVEPGAPVIWRGPMVAGALREMLGLADWGEADLLLVDMPPGTGDAILELGQAVALSGVVVVTTPQELSLSDTRRGIRAFEKLQVPVLGLVENMAEFLCDGCGERIALFGRDGGKAAAEQLGIPFLGRVPLDPAVVPGGDTGVPVAASAPQAPSSLAFGQAARAVVSRLALSSARVAFEITWKRMEDVCAEPPQPPDTSRDPDRPDAVWQAADDVLGILWGDGKRTFHGAFPLRKACPCAACVEEWTGKKLPALESVSEDVRPVTVRSVGRYALMPVWSDGHRTGMFSFRDLRAGTGAVPEPS